MIIDISQFDWRSWPIKNIGKLLLLGFSSGLPILLIFYEKYVKIRRCAGAKFAPDIQNFIALTL